MNHARILGVGSPSGDDQAGWLVIDALAGLANDFDLRKLDRPGAGLIELLDGMERVILIDAMHSGAAVGTIRRFDRHDWPGYAHGLSSHGFGVAEALALADALDTLPVELTLHGIEIASATPNGTPCDAVRVAARTLAGRIVAEFKEDSARAGQ